VVVSTAWCYASAVYAVALCSCLSATSRSSVKVAERIELVSPMGAPSTCPTLCCKYIQVPPNKGLYFAAASWLCCFNKTHRWSSLWITPAVVDTSTLLIHIVYCTLVSCNPLTPLLWFVLDLLYDFFLQLCSSWQDFNWHSASCGPSAVAELPVLFLLGCGIICQSLACYCCRWFEWKSIKGTGTPIVLSPGASADLWFSRPVVVDSMLVESYNRRY